MSVATNSKRIIRINVGGRVFETSKDTLLLSGESSKFTQLVQDINHALELPENGQKTEIFFDRDPECFEHILFYLRTASLAGVRDLSAVEKLKVESEFYGLGSGFQELLKSKERFLNLTCKDVNNVRKEMDLRKTYVVKLQVKLPTVDDYVKWNIERNENIIRIAIGHRTQCSTLMRYQVTEGDTYNLTMTFTVTTRMGETSRERLEKHMIKSITDQFDAQIVLISDEEIVHCAYCERLIPNALVPGVLSPTGGAGSTLQSPSSPTSSPVPWK